MRSKNLFGFFVVASLAAMAMSPQAHARNRFPKPSSSAVRAQILAQAYAIKNIKLEMVRGPASEWVSLYRPSPFTKAKLVTVRPAPFGPETPATTLLVKENGKVTEFPTGKGSLKEFISLFNAEFSSEKAQVRSPKQAEKLLVGVLQLHTLQVVTPRCKKSGKANLCVVGEKSASNAREQHRFRVDPTGLIELL